MPRRRYDHRRPAPGGFICSTFGDPTRLMSTAHTLGYEALGLVAAAHGWRRRGGGGVGQWLLLAPDGTVRLAAALAGAGMRVRTAAPAGAEATVTLPDTATAGQIAATVLALLPAEPVGTAAADGTAPGGAEGR